jgi:D-sedoheptulose 7-phosphate isomerase
VSISQIERYLEDLREATQTISASDLGRAASVLLAAWEAGATVYTLGNGGSASLASHMACDLGKNTASDLGLGGAPASRRLRVVSLADNGALLTALANDITFEDVFLEQAKSLVVRGDVVIAVSGSGQSPDILKAMAYARTVGATVIAFTGTRASATAMADLADLTVRAPVEMMEQIEDIHVIFNHILAVILRAAIAERTGAG